MVKKKKKRKKFIRLMWANVYSTGELVLWCTKAEALEVAEMTNPVRTIRVRVKEV